MNELKCPHCGQVFTIDEGQYAAIVQQVRGKEFDEAVQRETSTMRQALNAQHQIDIQRAVASAKESMQSELKAVQDALRNEQIKNSQVSSELQYASERQNNAVQQVQAQAQAALAQKEQEMAQKMLAVQQTHQKEVQDYQREVSDLKQEVQYYKDFKARQSTKMVGESLEQYCLTVFNNMRPLAFPASQYNSETGNLVYFEKDNFVSKSGSKGDFIYREQVGGVELLSIMFEMKNEMDTTATKHRNEDFFKELDKDRVEKGCEYAVLVSLLEADSDFYNQGIVDVSHRYKKMYVVRPQFFMTIISILRNAALNALESKQELAALRNMNRDFVEFDRKLGEFKDGITRNYELASRQFATAIEEIDKTIQHLEKVKASLQASDRNMRLLNDKAEDLSLRKLSRSLPVVQELMREQGVL